MKEKTGTYREPVQGHLEKGRERQVERPKLCVMRITNEKRKRWKAANEQQMFLCFSVLPLR